MIMKNKFFLMVFSFLAGFPGAARAVPDGFIWLNVSVKMIVDPATGKVPTISQFPVSETDATLTPLTTNDANLRQSFTLMNRWLEQTWRGYRVRLVDLVDPNTANPTFKRIGFKGDTTGPGKWFLSDLKNDDPSTVNYAFEAAAKADKANFVWNDSAINIYINDGSWSRANFPGSGYDNVITGYSLVSGNVAPNFYQTENYKIAGNILHEIGHFFGLFHTFSSDADDGIADTAPDNQIESSNETTVRNGLAQFNWQKNYSALTAAEKILVDNTANNAMSYYSLFYDNAALGRVLTDAERYGPTRFLFTELQMDKWADIANLQRSPVASGKMRFVDQSSASSGSGTSISPIKQLFIAVIASNASGDDILMLRPGNYTAATLSKPMVLRATRKGSATISKP